MYVCVYPRFGRKIADQTPPNKCKYVPHFQSSPQIEEEMLAQTLHLKLSRRFPVSSPGCDCEAQRKGGGEDVGNASKRRDRRGLIPSSRAKNAQPRVALRDCRQY